MTTSTFGDPRRRKAIDMSFWVADSNARVSKVIATDIMCVEKGINDVMVAMACAVRLEFKGNVDLQRRAVSMSDLKQVAEEVRADLKRRAQWLADLPMTRSIAFSFQWLANVVAFSAGMMGMHLATEAANLLTTAKHVDGLCPRWGDFFPERGPLQEQLAKLQLVDNKAVTAELPKAIRELDGRVRSCRALAEVCGQPPDAGPAKEAMHVARNALDWGKRTIQVAAATKILFFSGGAGCWACTDNRPNSGFVACVLGEGHRAEGACWHGRSFNEGRVDPHEAWDGIVEEGPQRAQCPLRGRFVGRVRLLQEEEAGAQARHLGCSSRLVVRHYWAAEISSRGC